jgi:ankyrin repeat protein
VSEEELMPLTLDARNGDVATVERLFKSGAKVDRGTIASDQKQVKLMITPLIAAATNGKAAVIAALLKAGANVHRTTEGGCTPLWFAAKFGHGAAVSVLA